MARDELILGQNQSREPGRGGRIFKAGVFSPPFRQAPWVPLMCQEISWGMWGQRGEREERILVKRSNAVSQQGSTLHGVPGDPN